MLAKAKKAIPAAKPAALKRIRIARNPKPLSLDDHDGLITLERLNDPRVPMDQVFRKAGYEVER
jgi:hypothetical protein